MPNFTTKVLSHYQIKAKQTTDNWQGEGCQNYDDSQDVCLDNEAMSTVIPIGKKTKCPLQFEHGLNVCPSCDSDNISNEDHEELDNKGETSLEVSCHDCGFQWLEIYKSNRCIEIDTRE